MSYTIENGTGEEVVAAIQTALNEIDTKASSPPPHGKIFYVVDGNFTVPAGVTKVWVSMCGGGGPGALNTSDVGCGGGAAKAVMHQELAVTPGETIAIYIGAKGVAGAIPTDGGTTAFGSLLSCPGGKYPRSSDSLGASGGVGGHVGINVLAFGIGGSGLFGVGGYGVAGVGYGSGGGYGGSGCDGTGGMCLVEW